MKKTIYLATYARNQLEQTDDSSIWAKPIPYSKRPSQGFSLMYEFDPDDLEDNEGINPIDDQYFYPDRTDPDTTSERLVQMDIKKIYRDEKKTLLEEKKSSVGKYPDAIYRCFKNVDAECWAKYDKGKIEIFSQHTYNFTGFGHVPNFTIKREECLDKVLMEGAGLCLNAKEITLCGRGYLEVKANSPIIRYDKDDIMSIDGKTYKLFQDHDDGARGRAIFTVKPKTRIKILYDDHCDNVRDWMMVNDLEFAKELGFNIDFKFLDRLNHDFYTNKYVPTEEDFKKDFHIDEKGKKKRAK